jgi:hypothetical protein
LQLIAGGVGQVIVLAEYPLLNLTSPKLDIGELTIFGFCVFQPKQLTR